MEVIAKVDGYHPATGLNLVKGEAYTIDKEQFSNSVFKEVKNNKDSAAKAEGGE